MKKRVGLSHFEGGRKGVPDLDSRGEEGFGERGGLAEDRRQVRRVVGADRI